MTPENRLGIVIRLDELKPLMQQYIDVATSGSRYKSYDALQLELTFSGFLLWLQHNYPRTNVVKGEFSSESQTRP